MFFHCLPVSRKYGPRQSELGLEGESLRDNLQPRAPGHRRRAHRGRAHLCRPQRCQGPRAIDHVGLAMDVLSFRRQNLGRGQKSTIVARASRVLNICVELEETKPSWMGCGCLGLVPAQQTMWAGGNQRSGPHLAN